MTVIEKYKDQEYGHTVEHENLFCPNCGKKEVYTDTGYGDFYEGSSRYCRSCKCSFTMPSLELDLNIEFID